jgi:ABC-type glycerol-3-phosphate transport system substrate-binding protein
MWQNVFFVVFAALVLLIYLIPVLVAIYNKKWDELRELAAEYMEKAEKYFGTGKGKEKFEYVFDIMYNTFMPEWMKKIVSEEMFREALEEWFQSIKDYLHKKYKEGATE